MRTGSHRQSAFERGYTLLGLMFVLAFGAVMLLRAVDAQQLLSHREREKELLFRGQALSRAIDEYTRNAPAGRRRWPTTLEELVLDRRSAVSLRHLRQVYADPFTGKPDWVLIPAVDEPGGFVGVKSRAKVKALRQSNPKGGLSPGFVQSSKATECVCDWAFLASQAKPLSARNQ